MLFRANRLRKEVDFEKVYKSGKSFKNGLLVLKVAQNNLKESRFGFIVSKKVSKKTTLRNKIKRRLRSIIRQNIRGIKKGADVVLIVLPGLEKNSFLETKEKLNNLFKRAGLA